MQDALTDLKAILHSKRANIYYLEKCRVMQKDGRVLYLTEAKKENQYYNIPIANTTCILLGTGTSITQAAVRMLTSAGVLIGFCGSGGTPLLMANEVEWLSPQSEYRPTEFLQGWLSFWFDDAKRLQAAQKMQQARIDYLYKIWGKRGDLSNEGFMLTDSLQGALEDARLGIEKAKSSTELLNNEARLTKLLYKNAARTTEYGDFVREHKAQDIANEFLNHGNYLAYGLAATTLWVLGFDVADLIKDTIVLPWAFICAKENCTEQEFRQQCLQAFTDHKALDFMFNTVKEIAQHQDWSE